MTRARRPWPHDPAVEERGPELVIRPVDCPHPVIVPVDEDWGRCTTCGDSTFPLSDFAAGMPMDPDAPPKKKRKSRSTYSARTIAECRRRGWIAGNVERRIPFPKPQGTTIDLFGIIDIIAIDLSSPLGQRTIGIQATSGGTGGSHSPHRAKILAEPRARQWLEAGNRLELWSWAKQGARGKAKRWTLRVEAFTAESWRTPFSGIERSATPESLQHVAEPMPLEQAVRAGIRRIARTEGRR